MTRDIDQIIERLKATIAGVEIAQLKVANPGVDDDGIWFVRVPGRDSEVQIESSSGACPFDVESDFCSERYHAQSVDEVISTVVRLFSETYAGGHSR
jgi:hypothetical protein